MRILSQDFPTEVKGWINTLLIPLNQFMGTVGASLNKGLTFGEHMNAEIKTIRLTSKDQPVLSHKLKSKPIGVIVIKSNEKLASAPSVDWETCEGGIKIRRVFGLELATPYNLTLLILGG